MDWVKLGTRYYDDDAIESLDDAAEVMFTRGLARAGELEREGFIPESSLPKLTRRRRYAAVVNELVRNGLWTRVSGGVQIVNWSDWQDRLDELAQRRTADRDRQRRRRERLRDHGESTVSRDNGHVSRDVTQGEGEGELEGVLLGGMGTASEPTGHPPPVDNHTREPPPWRCPQHTAAPAAGPCGPCGDHRRARQDWDRQQTAAVTAANRQAAAQRRTTPRCSRCGTRHQEPCTA